MKNAHEAQYIRNIISALMGAMGERGLDGVLPFARSNKLLTACVSSELLVERDCVGALDGQKRARAKAAEALACICSEFSADGVRCAVIKGLAFERAIYGDLPMRDVGDIDILIKAEDALRAHKKLCKMGYTQQLGPSSGSIASLGRARFAARISQQKYMVPESPLRRFPYKDAYCPYVKPGYPSVELHDGFRGLPSWYAGEVVERARGNRSSLVEDPLDTLVFLLANTYENAESFYSNCFDDKIALRDFVDLACYFGSAGNSLDWGAAAALIRELGIEGKAGRVLRDLNDLLPGEAEEALPGVPRLESFWGASIRDRVIDPGMRRRCVLRAIRRDLGALARKSKVGLAPAVSGQAFCVRPSGVMAYSLSDSGDGVVLRVGGFVAPRDGSCLVEFNSYPIAGVEPPLCRKIAVLLKEYSPVAYCRQYDRITDGFTTWVEGGTSLAARYDDEGDVVVAVPHELAGVLLREGETAISAGVFDRKHFNLFWARCRGKATLIGDVPVGRLSLYCGLGVASIVLELSFARCAVASDDARLLASLLAVFEGAVAGAPIDCDDKPVRGYAVMREAPEAYAVEVDGAPIGRGLSREEASSLLVQDITDWAVSELVKGSALAHASSNRVGDGAVLCMGPSGSGKTSLALALARFWPLRGDECSCVDLAGGMTWAEPLPVNVKANNEFALRLAAGEEALPCESELHGRTFCFSRQMVRSDSNPLARARIKAIIFPTYDKKAQGAEIRRPAHDALVPLVLGSLMGEGHPSDLLREFMRTVSVCGIKLLSARYSDAAAAARAVVEFVEGQERSCDVQVG